MDNVSHKNRRTEHVTTLLHVDLMSLTTSMSTTCFPLEKLIIFKAIKSGFKGSYDKQNLTHVVILDEIYETLLRFLS